MFSGLVHGAGLGLATGISCLASCGPIYLSYLLSEQRSGKQSVYVILLLNLGRFISYAGFGAIMGIVGGYVPSSLRIPLAFGGYLLFSVYLVISVVRINKTCKGCNIPKWMQFTKSPILLGILTGFSVCPAFLIAMTSAFESSGAFSGALLFSGFFIGTSIYMIPFAVFGLFSNKQWLNSVARYAAIFVAVYFTIIGVRGLASHFFSPRKVLIEQPGARETATIFNAIEQDSLYILTFPEVEGDKGSEMFNDLEDAGGPVFVLVEAEENSWENALASIPPLSGVIAPWWMDFRSEEELQPWQELVNNAAEEQRFRLFAIEYEPYTMERAGIIYQFLSRYSFRCDPNSGFTFLLTSDAGCSTLDCNTCPAYGSY
ncbi:hypothetical protein CSA37_01100 [Candidatus Fermentibacteria bacterium]|nr:MAG: hypothetical protein CSA37_01100 [Candidatus Fermentibacteria bacterium]